MRKWFLPGLSTPLLLVRDPVALYALLYAFKNNCLPAKISLNIFVIAGIIAFILSFFIGHQNLAISLFGARIFFIHIPFAYLIYQEFNKRDVVQMGKVFCFLAIPMAAIIMLQFYSPQSAWINRGVGGDISGAGFGGAMGYNRPPGTFSFTAGNASFFALVATFVGYFWMHSKQLSKRLLYLATLSVFLALPFSISRALIFNTALVLLFILFIQFKNPSYLPKMMGALIALPFLYIILVQIPAVDTAVETMLTRFSNAQNVEGGVVGGTIVDRLLGGMLGAIDYGFEIAFWGLGLGIGSNVASQLLSGSQGGYLVPEGEWGRIIGEIGVILGLTVIGTRLILAFKMFLKAYKRIKNKEYLPWILMSTSFMVLVNGNWNSPTNQGFFVITLGLILASFKPDASTQMQ